MEGSVKFFNRKKGFGFIHGEDGQDYFVHFSALPRGVFLRDNDKVSFDKAEGERGLKAENVQLLAKASDLGLAKPRGARREGSESGEEGAEEEQTEQAEEYSDHHQSIDWWHARLRARVGFLTMLFPL
ncbi:cold-shock protein [Candidatus Woesearchaeota archaeon]|nr:cold-shock protein [Candidatus Woesearchaeota archaeon]